MKLRLRIEDHGPKNFRFVILRNKLEFLHSTPYKNLASCRTAASEFAKLMGLIIKPDDIPLKFKHSGPLLRAKKRTARSLVPA
jgi:hypothetical protein